MSKEIFIGMMFGTFQGNVLTHWILEDNIWKGLSCGIITTIIYLVGYLVIKFIKTFTRVDRRK